MSTFSVNKGLDALYSNYDPAVNNLYRIEISDDKLNTLASLHAISVQCDGESLKLSRNKGTKNFQLERQSPYTLIDKLTITWRETKNWDVRKFHEEWIGMLYDKKNDQFQSLDKAKNPYKTFKIILPGKDGDLKLVFEKVLPCNISNLDLKWGNTANIIQHKLDYYVNGLVRWE